MARGRLVWQNPDMSIGAETTSEDVRNPIKTAEEDVEREYRITEERAQRIRGELIQWESDSYHDVSSGKPVLGHCVKCGVALRRRIEERLICAFCRTCELCGVDYSVAPNPPYACADCRCFKCKHPSRELVRDGENRVCVKCYRKAYPDRICRICKRYIPSILRKGDEKPTVCAGCGQNGTHYCYFCNNKSFGRVRKINPPHFNLLAFTCESCTNKYCCFNKGCLPIQQCNDCKARQMATEEKHSFREHLAGHPAECPGCNQFFVQVPWTEYKAPISRRKVNHLGRLVGFEIEASSIDLTKAGLVKQACETWNCSIVRDGSIERDDSGAMVHLASFEITSSPASGDFLVNEIDDLTTALREARASINDSCGLHIHVDARDHTYADIRKLLMAYIRIEPALLRTQPISRFTNRRAASDGHTGFCRPCAKQYAQALGKIKEIHDLKRQVLNAVYKSPDQYRRGAPKTTHYHTARYNAFNLHTYFQRGTVESRIHDGTLDAREIRLWAIFWGELVDRIYRMSKSDIEQLPNKPASALMALITNEEVRQYIQERWAKYALEHEPPKAALISKESKP